MGKPVQDDITENVLDAVTDLRQHIQGLAEQAEELIQMVHGRQQSGLIQELLELTNATSLAENQAHRLSLRLAGAGPSSTVCPPRCHRHCPWDMDLLRIERWKNEPDLGPDGCRLALYDFQRSMVVAANLADYFEEGLNQCSTRGDRCSPLLPVFCISSWMRRLARLLNRIGLELCKETWMSEKSCSDNS